MVISRNKCLPEDKYEYEVLKRIYEVLSGSEFVPPSKRPSKNGSKKKVEVATTGTRRNTLYRHIDINNLLLNVLHVYLSKSDRNSIEVCGLG